MQGYYTFRGEMDSRGHTIADSYDPPSHWNELYDNKLWWSGDNISADQRNKLYTLADMKEAAGKAQAMGCEALYLDPGRDTPAASKLWGEERLGKLTDFVSMLQHDYGGLKLSLHTPLSGWTGPPNDIVGGPVMPGAAMVNPDGRETPFECGASHQFLDEVVRRLNVLVDAGVCFLMLDGTVWMGECWSKDHGHSLPSTSTEHVEAMNAVANKVHETHPNVLIEMHDQLMGGNWLRYVPTYYGQGPFAPGVKGWDELWAFELMWSPMDDLIGGHSIALYYYNLAYSIPTYIHIDLRRDNAQCLMLWWNISTCRHLGVGGTHADATVCQNQKDALGIYRRLKSFFTTGVFYGIDELTHVHVDRKKTGAVINCFNLEKKPLNRQVVFEPTKYGLPKDRTYQFKGATFSKNGDTYACTVSIPAYGHTLIEIE